MLRDLFEGVFRGMLGVAGLALTSFTVQAVDVLDGPTLTMDPNGLTPLAGVVELTTDVPVRVEMTITNGADVRQIDFPDPQQQHYLPVLGLKPNLTYTVDLMLVPGGPLAPLFATTGPLPADFPTLQATVSTPASMEPGYTLLDCFFRDNGDPRPRFTMIVDSAGDVVWYSTVCASAIRQLANGDLFFRGGAGASAVRMDLLANTKSSVVLQVPGLGIHHDLLRTPHGTFLSLDQASVEVENFPTSDTDPNAPTATATVRDEPVVEFFPDGTLRREWSLVDMLDETRIAYSSLVETSAGFDWVHTNAVNYDPADDSVIVSVRHQDAVIKFSRQTGQLVWILGPHDNWSPEFQQYLLTPVGAPFGWQWHQHAPMWTPSGSLLLFDNGNFKASPFDGNTPVADEDNHSRGVEYDIDEQNMTVTQLWEYGESGTPILYSSFISDADYQPTTGNRLIHFGGVSHVDGVPATDLGKGRQYTRIVETTDDATPVKVFDFEMFDSAVSPGRLATYRSERIPGLYPQASFKAPNGVGDTVRMTKVGNVPQLSWTASPTDADHDAAEYYVVYDSSSAAAGFAIGESTALTLVDSPDGGASLVYYKLVAENLAGSSGDEPAP